MKLKKILDAETYQTIFMKEDYSIHDDGQYNMFLSQDETNRSDKIRKNKDKIDFLNSLRDEIEYYNKKNSYAKLNISENGDVYIKVDFTDILDEIGYFDWVVLPDGGDAYSDFGLEPLFEICAQYEEGMTPEEVIALVNKALDVYHQNSIYCWWAKNTFNYFRINKKQ